jgi:esterase/lipase superfamily enzyme
MFDEATIGWSTAHLVEFLDALGTSNLERVHVVAHSMGNRGLIGALERIRLAGHSLVRIGQLILAAPDIDAGEFAQKVPLIAPLGQRLTMYASSKDRALSLSRTVHGYARAGSADPSLTIVPPVETIDARAVDKSFFGHLEGGRVPEILEDIGTLMEHNTHPDLRSGLTRNVFDGLDYWALVPR